ncbi:pyridoxamine 5'-phosphate oxidase-like FMN-binding protein [Advenella kashmirensis WT001]|uniref:Pyridoxamine 5'-phosphate oxidase-like FMN-binding protein n=1 Tax=Advenella kashmirensis (strain DSM 17095 / LMG 22695 / WT001) TaxID=1036672 RepID=I3UGJ6_ADVKW|nr:pyridoxamine 5'-phosphate oxidase family protein [Advenella kashmirensis]AFK64134.1 pyridoxamine 5'-phosphate oxidase-like FMN-binding protein [Advenella kashmirensis WT001]
MSNNIDMLTLAPEIDRLHQECLSLIMATTNAQHAPCASYTPFAYMDDRFYILVSALAVHGQNLKVQPALDILLIEDESRARNIYARLRLNYQVTASPVEKGSEEHDRAITLLGQRAGKTVALLDSLDDFTLYRLTPLRATLVQGFGKAFVFDPMDLSEGAIALNDKNIDQYR